MTVIIGVDPHKASHTAVAISDAEQELDRKKVRSGGAQLAQLVSWAEPYEASLQPTSEDPLRDLVGRKAGRSDQGFEPTGRREARGYPAEINRDRVEHAPPFR